LSTGYRATRYTYTLKFQVRDLKKDSEMDYPKPIGDIEELPKNYGGLEREKFWQQYWMDCGVYRFDPTKQRSEIFSVDTPPPTVSGALHIGHVYSYTQTDMNVRYQRMKGKHIFYPFGFDDNGLPTERLVEREKGIRAHEVGREKFIEECRPIVEAAEQEFIALWQSLALSCDWSQFYTTIADRSRAISQASFIDLYNKGIVYRREAPTQWCWADQTAIAQAEIEDKEVAGQFHDITFHVDNDGELIPVTIATTRPELIPACVALLAHPEDERYKHLFGKKAITPLFEVEVPVLPSEKADPEKGTGILMCCTFGDQEDVEHWELYALPTRVIIGQDGRLIDFSERYANSTRIDCSLAADGSYDAERRSTLAAQWPSRNPAAAHELAQKLVNGPLNAKTGEFHGAKVKQARTMIVELLAEAGVLGNVRDIMHTVRHSERGGVPVEILVTQQWYVRLLEHKRQLIDQGRRVKWHPEYMFKRFEHWVENLNADWCISRQRYNGVPFPVWYVGRGEQRRMLLANLDQLPVNPLIDKPSEAALRLDVEQNGPLHGYNERVGIDGYADMEPDPDVMDTWATSSVTPLLNTEYDFAKSVADNAKHNKLFPFDMRPQAHDIIRTWAFYTIAKSLFHFGMEQDETGKWVVSRDEEKLKAALPWKDIVISGHAQDASRGKISKSKGHGVSPAQMVEQYTADNLRYWSGSPKLGTDTIYDEKSLGEGRKLINKLFNATKFALRHLVDFDPTAYGSVANSATGPRYDTDALLKLVTYPTDRWMLRQLQHAEERATKAQDAFEFGDSMKATEEFFWGDFCDNYLELSKGRLYGDAVLDQVHPELDAAALKLSAQAALFIALSVVLRMFAPVLPHITEECWSWYHAQWSYGRSIHEQPWPTYDRHVADKSDEVAGQLLVEILATVRKWKSQNNISIKKPVAELIIYNCGDAEQPLTLESIAAILGDLRSTTNSLVVTIREGKGPETEAYIEGYPFSVDCVLAEEEAR
jgi:valyl-tRNA synthetase